MQPGRLLLGRACWISLTVPAGYDAERPLVSRVCTFSEIQEALNYAVQDY